MLKSLQLSLLAAFIFVFAGCSSSDKIDTNTPEGAFKLAEKYEKDERYEEAITYYSEVKNKHPYSRFATSAELRIADIEFKRENFAEAESAYKLFKELHPDHEKSAYVTHQLGLSLMKQLPSTTDRDLTLASRAILYFDEVISSFSTSTYVKQARENRTKTQKMLADKEQYIADWYYKKEKYQSALGRYEDLLKQYPGLGYDKHALYQATLSAYKSKDMEKAKTYFKQLLAQYPKSSEVESARKELSDGF